MRDPLPIGKLSDQDLLDYKMRYRDDKFVVRLIEEYEKLLKKCRVILK